MPIKILILSLLIYSPFLKAEEDTTWKRVKKNSSKAWEDTKDFSKKAYKTSKKRTKKAIEDTEEVAEKVHKSASKSKDYRALNNHNFIGTYSLFKVRKQLGMYNLSIELKNNNEQIIGEKNSRRSGL